MNDPVNASDPSGLDALIMVGRNKANPRYFKDKAMVDKMSYERANPGKTASVVEVRSFDDVNNALKNTPNIDRLDYYGHGGIGKLYLSDESLSSGQVASLDKSNVKPGANINLLGCDTAGSTGGSNSIAQAFANHFNTDVTGIVGGLSFGFPIRGAVFLPWAPRANAATVSPGQTTTPVSKPTSPFVF